MHPVEVRPGGGYDFDVLFDVLVVVRQTIEVIRSG